jgi:predicted permease
MRWSPRGRNAARREIDDELSAHIEARVDQLIARGMPPAEARAEALRRFGDLDSGRKALYRAAVIRPRRLRLSDRLADLFQDFRYVIRTLRRSPSFTGGVIATLALGLGINAAVFRVADFVLLRAPSGVAHARDVRRVELSVAIGRGVPLATMTFPWTTAERVINSRAFDRASAYVIQTGRDGDGRDLTINYVDGNYLDVLGVQPAIGRGFSADEGTPGRGVGTAIVSRDYWLQHLGGAPIDSRPDITIGTKKYPVVGVMPGAFRGIDLDPVDVWLPLGAGEFGYGTINGVVIPWYRSTMMRAVRTIGRRHATTNAAIAAELDAALKSDDEETRRTTRVIPIAPIGSTANRDTNAMLARLALVSVLILVIACANAANLLLARGLRRQPEIAIRMAIGASRRRVARLLVIESIVLAGAAGAAAALAAFWTAESLRRLLFPDAKWTAGAIDQRTLVVTVALALIAGVTAGLMPALQSTSRDLVSRLKHHRLASGGRSRMTRTVLIVVQTALSLTLLIASGLLIRSLDRLNAVPMGFAPKGLVTVSLAGSARPGGSEPASGELGAIELADRLAQNEKVEGAALATQVPFGAMAVQNTKVIGATSQPSDDAGDPRWTAVSPNYFTVMRTRVISGRGFAAGDKAGAEPVALLIESMARAYFGGAPPANACVLPVGLPCHRIIGVVEDVRDTPNGGNPPLRYYLPLAQSDYTSQGIIIRVRTPGSASALAADSRTVAALARSVLPATQRATIEVISERVSRALRPWQTATWLFGAIGILALGLACIGIYSVMTYVASERIHELGVRVVLGATGGDIARLVLLGGLRMTLGGCALGLLTAMACGRYLGTLLFGVSPFDPLTYGVALACLAAASLVAVLPPARRASRVDPVEAFRS